MGLLVLGMHRSGTSAVTMATAALGVPLGDPDDQLPAAADNDAGFAESRLLSQNNEILLDALGGRWDAPPELTPGWERKPMWTELLPVERDLFQRVHPTTTWVWKDPRACVLAPFWYRVLGRDQRIVLVLRHPLGVARSLAHRDGLTMRYGLALWERYTRLALAHAEGFPVLVSNYTRIMHEPAHTTAWARELSEFVRDDAVASPADPVKAVREVLRHDLRHNCLEPEPFDDDGDSTPSQRSLHMMLCAMEGSHPVFRMGDLPPESPETTWLLAGHRACRGAHCEHRAAPGRAVRTVAGPASAGGILSLS